MKNIYIVEGNCGEYSDRVNWLVKAFHNEDAAIKFKEKLMSICNKYGATVGAVEGEEKNKIRELDPQFQSDYTGTIYFVLNVELGDL